MLGYAAVISKETQAMRNVYNFSAGPAMLPEEVLLQAQAEMLDWHGTGMSIMELSHRGAEFKEVMDNSEADLRELMNIPKHYKTLFITGGASTQFAMVPMNLFPRAETADYIDTGVWSRKAIAEAKKFGNVNVAAQTGYENEIAYVPRQDTWRTTPDAAYLHYTPNETIDGLEFQWVPKTQDVPLVADMTSMILSRPINVEDYGIIYAGAQKNIGQTGLTVVIIREDLIQDPLPRTPTLFTYKIQNENNSVFNTPATYSWYIASLVFAWMKRNGGVKAFYEINKRKAKRLYDTIDKHSGFYISRVRPDSRSMTNVMFYLKDESLTPTFLEEAKELDMKNLRGHKVSGGVRASIYNAMPEIATEKLADFMEDFVKRHG